ncbi:MAG: biotin/lipoyl attachment domain-containing protein [Acidobacteria bacterium OLB17]|nr:MAG: biotin/lipoyl attachment domain-containing protein [Acidobacteria bacterium OLB17]MCZ2391834.1 biotin/lipoyl-binding protein [Acidobacteriota bacterium]
MKLQAKIGDETSAASIRREAGRVFAEIDGRKYEFETLEPEAGRFTLLSDAGKKVEARVFVNAEGRSVVWIDGHAIEVELIDPRRLRGSAGADADAAGAADVKTAMPGKVVRLIAAVGDTVEKGDPVIVVEAMKMQNEIRAPKNGVVASVRVSDGDTVNAGQILLSIE